MNLSRGLTPYLLLGVLALGTGLGAALGVSEGKLVGRAEMKVACSSMDGGYQCLVSFPNISNPPKDFGQCMERIQAHDNPSGVVAFKKDARRAFLKCDPTGQG
ncbi:MAG: hypothetical protein ACLQRH_18980 [Acidimicrobiales bacterium]